MKKKKYTKPWPRFQPDSDHAEVVRVNYINYRGEKSIRLMHPIQLKFGNNRWHKTDQWLLEAWDTEKKKIRTFAVKDITSWEIVNY